jgi:hypothetical protein
MPGCGKSIDHMRGTAKWCVACGVDATHERKLAYNRLRTTESRKAERRTGNHTGRVKDHSQEKAVNPHQNRVLRGAHSPNPRQNPCKVCWGMSWARVPERVVDDSLHSESVVGKHGLCRGCGQPWAPEPPPERGSFIGSSAGIAVVEGRLFGYADNKGQKRAKK